MREKRCIKRTRPLHPPPWSNWPHDRYLACRWHVGPECAVPKARAAPSKLERLIPFLSQLTDVLCINRTSKFRASIVDRPRTKFHMYMLSSWKHKMNDRSVPFELQVGISRVGNSTIVMCLSPNWDWKLTRSCIWRSSWKLGHAWRMHGKTPETYKHHIANKNEETTTRPIAVPHSQCSQLSSAQIRSNVPPWNDYLSWAAADKGHVAAICPARHASGFRRSPSLHSASCTWREVAWPLFPRASLCPLGRHLTETGCGLLGERDLPVGSPEGDTSARNPRSSDRNRMATCGPVRSACMCSAGHVARWLTPCRRVKQVAYGYRTCTGHGWDMTSRPSQFGWSFGRWWWCIYYCLPDSTTTTWQENLPENTKISIFLLRFYYVVQRLTFQWSGYV
jgi:hypothetical protein